MKPDGKYLLSLAGCVALITVICLANNKQEEAAALIERAKQLSDIWGTNAPACHLKANLTLYAEKGTNEGTYTEFWRRETAARNFHRIEVARENKRWVLDSSKDVPPNANEPAQTLAVWELNPHLGTVGTIRERTLHGELLRCVETKPDPMGGKSALCFDKATGVLVVKVVPHELQERISDHTCQYGDYQKFGEKTFPRFVRCFDDGKLKLEMRVIELNTPDNLRAELFLQPAGAHETLHCQGPPKPPKPVYTPDPAPPRRQNPKYPGLVLLVMVGKMESRGTSE